VQSFLSNLNELQVINA